MLALTVITAVETAHTEPATNWIQKTNCDANLEFGKIVKFIYILNH